ncbi:winged helix-turn-helix domain-containing protein [Pseudodesulfovibrio sp. zrk46]|uniref:winged helix-turn-helix domain-containing protein n=1 Tax=Pseudodesulfovibrio sp. zrk46 TaxID=2725288 RepID=UPI00144A1A05|nr:winged helix-turn-helix domain-containing protein [Pseudodesulfovibrio sp. zrk46]QJB58418.1 winged helix-turn-helix transcriptional regulator [Pseudodesulfovibrio sp. zrk46]
MLAQLFASKTRIRVLLKLFLNPEVSCYLRELASEFELSPNSLKVELDNLSEAGYLVREQSGRSVYFRANKKHPFFPEVSSIVRKSLGIDKLIDEVIKSLGSVEAAYILDDYAVGKDSGLIDVLVVGDINRERLNELRGIVEGKISRKVRVMDVTPEDFEASRDVFLKRPNWKVV